MPFTELARILPYKLLVFLTTRQPVVIVSNMKARELFNRRVAVAEDAFAELVLWEVAQAVPGSTHRYKYRLAFIVDEACVLRYDNEAGKGDHRHVGDKEMEYHFVSVDRLVADFFEDVRRWCNENSND